MRSRMMAVAALLTALAFAQPQSAAPNASIEIRHFVAPQYPEMARLARLEGDVKATLSIGVDGKLRSVQVTSGYPLLRAPVETALREWSFAPLTNITSAQVVVAFRLDCSKPVTVDFPGAVKISACPPVVETNVS